MPARRSARSNARPKSRCEANLARPRFAYWTRRRWTGGACWTGGCRDTADSLTGTSTPTTLTQVIELRRAREDEWAAVGELTAGAYLADGAMGADDPYYGLLRDAASRSTS